MLKKAISISSFYLLPITLAILTYFFPSRDLFSNFGTLALLSLALVLYIKPLSILINLYFLKYLMTLRREIGLTSFYFYLFHAIGQITSKGLTPAVIFDSRNFIFYGAMAGTGMIALALTSNDFAVRLLRRNWKRLHRISYLVFFLASYHSSLAEGSLTKFYIGSGTFILLKTLQFLKTKTL